MKYLLKTKQKQNATNEVSITLTNAYDIFERMKYLISYLFKNAAFIESYEIYILEDFEPIEEPTIANVCSCNSISLESPNSQAIFS